jgi:hypothetical protein
MSVSLALPPSGRDFFLYQRVVVDAASTRTVAEEARISQTRVRQIVKRVMQWLVETLPQDTELSEAAKLLLGQHIAADRLERFYGESNRAWTQTTQSKFANLCLRVIAAQAKIPALPGTLEALAADAILGPLPDDTASLYADSQHRHSSRADTPAHNPQSEIVSSPPTRDCSPTTPAAAAKATQQPPASAATSTPAVPSSKLPPAAAAARKEFLAPAHPVDDAGDHSPVTEIKITPQQLGLRANMPLTRKERRRLRRLAMAK